MSTFNERTRAAWAALFSKDRPEVQAANPQGSLPEEPKDTFAAFVRGWGEYFQSDKERKVSLQDFNEMDAGDIAIQLDTTVDAATLFEDEESSDDPLLYPESFKIVFPTTYATSRARKVIEQVLGDTNLRRELPVYARDMLKYGDAFAELIPDAIDDKILRRVLHKQTADIRVNRDNKGRLERGTDKDGNPRAYQQVDSAERPIAGWFPNEMVHFKLFPDSALSYSAKGMLSDIRDEWRKLAWIEQGMVIARVVRAYPRLVHMIDTTNKSETEAASMLKKYVASITQKITSAGGTKKKVQMAVDEDYFVGGGYVSGGADKVVPKLNNISLLDPQINGLGNIADVQHQRRKVFARVPGEMVGIMDNSGQELTSQDIAYGRFVKKVQRRLEDGVRQIIDTALKMQGIEVVTYRIIWPKVVIGTAWKFADAKFRLTMANRNLLEMGCASPESILRDEGKSDEEIKQILGEWNEHQDRLTAVAVDQATKLAKIVPAATKLASKTAAPGSPNPTTGTGAAGGKTGAGNKSKRTATKPIPTKGGLGQAAQGYSSGG